MPDDESLKDDSAPPSSEDLLRQAKEGLPAKGPTEADSPPPREAAPENDVDLGVAPVPPRQRDEPIAPTTETEPPVPTASQAGYRSPTRLSVITRVFLVLWVPFAAAAAATSITTFRVVTEFREAPLRVGGSALDAAALRLDAVGILWILALLGTGAVFIAWIRVAYGNLEAFGAKGSLRWSVGWSVGAWFVPFLNLWRPKQIVDDTWRASDPNLPRGPQRGGELRPPLLHHVWWGLWIVVGSLGYFTLRAEASNLDSLQAFLIADSASSVVTVFAAIAAYWVVTGTTARQEARADRVFADRQQIAALAQSSAEPGAFDRFWPTVLGLLAIGMLAFAATFVAFDNPSDATDGEFASDDTLSASTIAVFGAQTLVVGDCFELTPGGSTETMSCSQAHTFETFALTTHPAGTGAPYPGPFAVDEFALEACLGEFEAYVGSGLLGSGLDVTWFTPTSDSWAAQDRGVVCALTPITYVPIEGSLAGSGGLEHEGIRGFGELQLGDCFDDQSDPTLGFVSLTACDDPHDNEVYTVAPYPLEPEGPYPGEDALAAFALETCTDGFAGFVGVSIFDSSLLTYEIWPSPFTWSAGDQAVVCVLFDPDFAKLDRSMRGSER